MNRMTPWKKFISRLRELMGFDGDTIQVGNDMEVDGDLEVNSSVKAASLTDGTTTKTMTEVLAGGGGNLESGSLPVASIPDGITLKINKWVSDGNTLQIFLVFDSTSGGTIKNNNCYFRLAANNYASAGMSEALFNKVKDAFINSVVGFNGVALSAKRNASLANTDVDVRGAMSYWGSTAQAAIFSPDATGVSVAANYGTTILFTIPLV